MIEINGKPRECRKERRKEGSKEAGKKRKGQLIVGQLDDSWIG